MVESRVICALLAGLVSRGRASPELVQAVLPPDMLLLRPPAVPLIVRDPFFSMWSRNDNLTDDYTVHWTIAESGRGYKAMNALVRVDGTPYRLMGPDCIGIAPMQQLGYARVYATSTLYRFAGAGVAINLTWTQPVNASDFDTFLPYSYVTWDVSSADGGAHAVQVYLDVTGQLAVNDDSETLVWARDILSSSGAQSMRMGTAAQPVLQGYGDDFRIDWGWLHLTASAPDASTVVTSMASSNVAKHAFAQAGGTLPPDEVDMPVAACSNATQHVCGCQVPGGTGWDNDWPALALAYDFGYVVPGAAPASRFAIVSYDDVVSISMFGVHMQAYWRRGGMSFTSLLDSLLQDYDANMATGAAIDAQLLTTSRALGLGEEYERIVSLSYRQTLGDNVLVYYNGTFNGSTPARPLLFVKGADSSGDTGTLDDNLPAWPLYQLFNPELIECFIAPLLMWAGNETFAVGQPFPRNMTYGWPWAAHAPHYLGQHPVAELQCWFPPGFVQWCEPMPIEMSADMLILLATAALGRGGDYSFIEQYFDILDPYADYLVANGLYPGNERSSDDYEGFIINSTHLALKAVVGIGAWARVCNATGRTARAGTLWAVAQQYRDTWLQLALDPSGQHTMLTYGAPGTWSIKYSLLHDAYLQLHLFDSSIAAMECNWLNATAAPFGWVLQTPSPRVNTWTNLGWEEWMSSLCGSAIASDVYRRMYAFVNSTPQRVALGDWYDAATAAWMGFTARAQVGGVFANLLMAAQAR